MCQLLEENKKIVVLCEEHRIVILSTSKHFITDLAVCRKRTCAFNGFNIFSELSKRLLSNFPM